MTHDLQLPASRRPSTMTTTTTNDTSYVSGLTHPESWIHDNDQVLLVVGMSWWYALTLLLCLIVTCVFTRIRRMPMIVSGVGRIIAYCLALGIVYMYTSAREFLYERVDQVLVRTWFVLSNGAIQILLIYIGSVHCVLSPVWHEWVLALGIFANFQTVLASFAAAEQQWAGWVIGALCNTPIPVIWLVTQRRNEANFLERHTIAWILLWLGFRTAYAVIQLCGHTFEAGGGMDTTTELALTFVLHTFTLFPLVYVLTNTREPPPAPGRYSKKMSNGDTISLDVEQYDP